MYRRIISVFLIAAVVAFLGFSSSAFAKKEIIWWHAMGSELTPWVNDLAKGFNESQSEFEVKPVYKGTYSETMNAAITAFQAGKQPHIVQVFEVGTATMMAADRAIYPVYQLMQETNTPFDINNYLPAIVSYYSTLDNKLLSLPFNSSTPVFYYNKDVFKKAGLDPNKPPKTWEEVEEAAKKILSTKATSCGFTTAWQSWIQIENFNAWHDLPIGTKSNGFEGMDTQLLINSPENIKHIQKMADWHKDKVFVYGGRKDSPIEKFLSGECAMFMHSSAGYASLKDAAKFDFGISMLPYWDNMRKSPQNSIIGGATLWVLQGLPKEDYAGVAQFFNYLSSPEVQAASHQRTGYLPVTKAAYELTKEQGFYEKNPGLEVAVQQLTLHDPTSNSRGLRFGNYLKIRDIIDEELESVWGGKKSAKEALDNAVKRGNDVLKAFEKINKKS